MSAVPRATTPPRSSGLKRHQLDIDGMHWHGFVTPGQKFSTKRLDDEVSTALPSQCTSVGLFDSLPTTPACDYVMQTGQASVAPSWEPQPPVWRPSGIFSVDGWCGQPQSGLDLEALKAFLNGDQDAQQFPVVHRPQSPIKEEELDEPLTPLSMATSGNAVLAGFSTPPATPRHKSTEQSLIIPSGVQLAFLPSSFSSPPLTPRNRSTEPSMPSCSLTLETLMQHGFDMDELQRPSNDDELQPLYALQEVVQASFSSPHLTPREQSIEQVDVPSCPFSALEADPALLSLEALWEFCPGKEVDEMLTPWSMSMGMESHQFVTPSLLAPAAVSTCPLAPGESPYPPLLTALMQHSVDMVQSAIVLDPEAACFPFWDHGVEPPVCAALRFGCCVEILEALIRSGASVTATDSYGQSPLHVLRSSAGFSMIVFAQIEDLLVKAGAVPLVPEPQAGKLEDTIAWCFPVHEGVLVNPLLTDFQLPPPPSPNP